jgi:hypothetical protein
VLFSNGAHMLPEPSITNMIVGMLRTAWTSALAQTSLHRSEEEALMDSLLNRNLQSRRAENQNSHGRQVRSNHWVAPLAVMAMHPACRGQWSPLRHNLVRDR